MKFFIPLAALLSFSASASLIQTEVADFSISGDVTSSMGNTQSKFQSYMVDGFDPTLGELTGVTISVDSVLRTELTLQGESSARGYVSYDNYHTLYDEAQGNIVLSPYTRDYRTECTGPDSCLNTVITDINYQINGLDVLPLDYFMQDTFYFGTSNELKDPFCFGTNCTLDVSNNWQGTAQFHYEYRPAAAQITQVSEPSSFAIALGGFAVLLFGVRRRQKQ